MKIVIPEHIAREGIESGEFTRWRDGSYRFTDPEFADIRIETGPRPEVFCTPEEAAKLADWGAPWLQN